MCCAISSLPLFFRYAVNAGRPEGVVPDPRLDASAARPPADREAGVLLPDGLAGERAGLGRQSSGTKASGSDAILSQHAKS